MSSRAPTSGRVSLAAVLLLASGLICATGAGAAVFSADAVKAAFLFRFASFVQWPADAPASDAFVIGVVGDDEVANQLEHLVPGMSVRGQSVVVKRVTRVSDLDAVRILFIGHDAGPRARALRDRAMTLPILLVTDRQDDFGAGAVINFIETPRNVRFEVSLLAADRARLTIDSALLAVAVRVERRARWYPRCDDCGRYAAVLP